MDDLLLLYLRQTFPAEQAGIIATTRQSGYCGDHGVFDEKPAVVRGFSGKVLHDPRLCVTRMRRRAVWAGNLRRDTASPENPPILDASMDNSTACQYLHIKRSS